MVNQIKKIVDEYLGCFILTSAGKLFCQPSDYIDDESFLLEQLSDALSSEPILDFSEMKLCNEKITNFFLSGGTDFLKIYFLTELGSLKIFRLNDKETKFIDLTPKDVKAKSLKKQKESLYLITSNDELYALGENLRGALGVGSEKKWPEIFTKTTLPKIKIKEFIRISVELCCFENDSDEDAEDDFYEGCYYDRSRTFVLSNEGELFACGDNSDGALGIGISEKKCYSFVNITPPEEKVERFIVFKENSFSLFVLTKSGKLFFAGLDNFSLFDEVEKNYFQLKQIFIPDEIKISTISGSKKKDLICITETE